MTGGLPFPGEDFDTGGETEFDPEMLREMVLKLRNGQMDDPMGDAVPLPYYPGKQGGGLPPPRGMSSETRSMIMEQIKRLSQPQQRKTSMWTDPAFLAGMTLLGGGNFATAAQAASNAEARAEQTREMGDARRATSIASLTGKLADADKNSALAAKAQREAGAKALALVAPTQRGRLAKLLTDGQIDPTDMGAVYGVIEQNQLPFAPNLKPVAGVGLVDMGGEKPVVVIPVQHRQQIVTVREGGNDVAYQINPDGTRTKIGEGPAWAPQHDDKQLVEIADETSPTGTRLVPRSQAINQPGKPPNGMRLESDGKGGFTLVQGRQGAGGPLDRQTVKEIEEKQLNSAEQLSRLDRIETAFRPEYLQLGTRAGNKLAGMKDFVGMKLTPDETKNLTDYTQFRREATTNLNQTIKDITGAAMGVQEAERIIATMPNAGTGVFDGDSPTEFKAKLAGASQAAKHAMMRYSYAKANGLDPLKTGIELHDVPKLITERGQKLEAEIASANPGASPEAIKAAVRDRLAAEFGIKSAK